jgi:hypothetical protein
MERSAQHVVRDVVKVGQRIKITPTLIPFDLAEVIEKKRRTKNRVSNSKGAFGIAIS